MMYPEGTARIEMDPESLKPLDEHVGQRAIIEQLKPEIISAANGQHQLPNFVLHGPPGLGKTRLVYLIAKVMGIAIKEIKGSVIKQVGAKWNWADAFKGFNQEGFDAKGHVSNPALVKQQILLIDECEEVPTRTWETIHSVLQPGDDGRRIYQMKVERHVAQMLNLPSGTSVVDVWVPYITFVFTTNYLGKLRQNAAAMVDRCRPNVFAFELYGTEDIIKIISEHSTKRQVNTTPEAALAIAQRSRGVPRNAKGWWTRCYHFMLSESLQSIDAPLVDRVMRLAEVDPDGLTAVDINYLTAIKNSPNMKLSLDTLEAMIDTDSKTIEEEVEPWLMRCGYITRGAGGRVLTPKGMCRINATDVLNGINLA